MMPFMRQRGSVVLLATAVATACGDGGGTQEPPPTPTIGLAAAAGSVDVLPGGTATINVNVTRGGGFNGPVSVSAEGVPAGVTIASASVAAGAASAAMAVNATAAAAVGSSTVTLRATGTGVNAATTTVTLNVLQPPSPGGIAIALNPAGIMVPVGGSGTVNVTLSRSGGFTGPVTLSAEGTPPNVTIPNAVIPENGTTGQITITAGATAQTGSTNMTIRATGTGVAATTAPLVLTITQAPGFTMALNPTAVTVAAGQQTQANLTLTRIAAFTGAVNLSAAGAPAGMTVTFNPASVTQNTSQVNVATTAAVAPGTYPLTITGTSAGVTTQTATLSVTVTGGTGGGNVVFQFCEADGLPLWVAAQDGDGAWQRVTGDAQHRYSFQVSSARGGIAYVLGNGGSALNVMYMSAQELQGQGPAQCSSTPGPTRNVTINVQGAQATDQIFVSVGNAAGGTLGFQPTFPLQGIEPGPVDMIASRLRLVGTAIQVDRLFLQRGLNPANGATLTVDFNGANSFAPVVRNLTIGNLGSDQAFTFVTYITAGGSSGTLSFGDVGGGTQQYRGFPASAQIAGDLHLLFVSAQSSAQATDSRFAVRFFQAATDQTLTLGPTLTAPTITTLATQPHARLRASYAIQQQYNSSFSIAYEQSNASRVVQVDMTAAYHGAGPTVTLDIPDLSGVAGWNNAWGLTAGAATTWTLTALRQPGAVGSPTLDGMTIEAAQRSGIITP